MILCYGFHASSIQWRSHVCILVLTLAFWSLCSDCLPISVWDVPPASNSSARSPELQILLPSACMGHGAALQLLHPPARIQAKCFFSTQPWLQASGPDLPVQWRRGWQDNLWSPQPSFFGHRSRKIPLRPMQQVLFDFCRSFQAQTIALRFPDPEIFQLQILWEGVREPGSSQDAHPKPYPALCMWNMQQSFLQTLAPAGPHQNAHW